MYEISNNPLAILRQFPYQQAKNREKIKASSTIAISLSKMKSFTDIVSWMGLLVGLNLVEDKIEENQDQTETMAPETRCHRTQYDPNFRLIDFSDEWNDRPINQPDSYIRYDSSLGRADTSDIEAYRNRPPPPNCVPPPPYWPAASYVPPPAPEHVVGIYDQPEIDPVTKNGDEDLIDLFTDQTNITTSPCVQDELDKMREKLLEVSNLLQLEKLKNFDLQQRIIKLEAEKEEMSHAHQTPNSAASTLIDPAIYYHPAQVTLRRILADLEKEKQDRMGGGKRQDQAMIIDPLSEEWEEIDLN
ncbi:hypothetical protein GHT06_011182 [Daphnia sinensis]|uniref:Uncharacterized protein n=1 Tax=Daphnia sinensis TaxID=1820382 RepID=A0AAD5LTH9_9CRUS|nr:hypothetical protein GHT06_011182 [Daphnia sinensis]